jgi:hypothetical protein
MGDLSQYFGLPAFSCPLKEMDIAPHFVRLGHAAVFSLTIRVQVESKLTLTLGAEILRENVFIETRHRSNRAGVGKIALLKRRPVATA